MVCLHDPAAGEDAYALAPAVRFAFVGNVAEVFAPAQVFAWQCLLPILRS